MGRLTSNDGVQEFGMKITGYEICTCSDVMERKGEKGAPHAFVA